MSEELNDDQLDGTELDDKATDSERIQEYADEVKALKQELADAKKALEEARANAGDTLPPEESEDFLAYKKQRILEAKGLAEHADEVAKLYGDITDLDDFEGYLDEFAQDMKHAKSQGGTDPVSKGNGQRRTPPKADGYEDGRQLAQRIKKRFGR